MDGCAGVSVVQGDRLARANRPLQAKPLQVKCGCQASGGEGRGSLLVLAVLGALLFLRTRVLHRAALVLLLAALASCTRFQVGGDGTNDASATDAAVADAFMPHDGGAIKAAAFLDSAVEDGTEWAHLDIAGTFWSDRDRSHAPKGPQGPSVRTLVALAERYAHS